MAMDEEKLTVLMQECVCTTYEHRDYDNLIEENR